MMSEQYKEYYDIYASAINQKIKEADFCVYEEFIRLGKKYEAASELHELEEMEYYAKCLLFFKGLVNLETKRKFSFSHN